MFEEDKVEARVSWLPIKIRSKGFLIDFVEILVNKGIACVGTALMIVGSGLWMYVGLFLFFVGFWINLEIKIPEESVEEHQIYPKENKGEVV